VSSLKEAGARAFIWDFSGRFIQHAMAFVVTIILTRILSPTDFGLVALVMSVIAIAATFSDAGLGVSLIRKRRLLPIHYSSVFIVNLFVGICLTIIAYLLAPVVANFFENPELTRLTQALSPLFVLWSLSSLQTIRLRKDLNYALITKITITSAFMGGLGGIVMAFNGAGVWSLVVQALVHASIYNLLIWAATKWRPALNFSLKALRSLWAFGFRVFLVDLMESVFSKLDNLIIGKLFLPETLGYFSRAKALDQMITNYSSASLMSVLFPVLSQVQNELSRFRAIVLRSLGIISFVVFLLLGIFYLSSSEIVLLLFGENWAPTIPYFKILLVSGFGYPIGALLINTLYSRGDSKDILRLEVAKKILFGINLSIAFTWGVEGYLYGLIVATILATLLNMFYGSKVIDVAMFELVKPVLLQAIIAIVIVFFIVNINVRTDFNSFIRVIINTLGFTLIYFIVNKLFATKSFEYFLDELVPLILKLIRRKTTN